MLTFNHRKLNLHTAWISSAGCWGSVIVDSKDGKGRQKGHLTLLNMFLCWTTAFESVLHWRTSNLQPQDVPVEVRTRSCDFSAVYWNWNTPRPKTHEHPLLLYPLPWPGLRLNLGQSSLLCGRSNLVTMAAGISSDGLQRVRGSCPGLRNNKKKAVTVTFELWVIGLAQKFVARGVRKRTGVTHNFDGQLISSRRWWDLQRTQWSQ